MASSTKQRENSWTNRFQTPSLSDLLRPMEAENEALLRVAREHLLGLDGISEEIAWHGIPWRWTLIYGKPKATRALAYLIPQPANPQIVIPVREDFIEGLPRRCVSRHIRDGLTLCASVAGVRWAQWDLASEALLAEVLDLACRKHKQTRKRSS